MADLNGKVLSQLVIQFGFSQRNAEIALEMFREGKLNKSEEEVINRIQLNPDCERQVLSYYKSHPVAWVAERLNYRITLEGGDRVTKSPFLSRSRYNDPMVYLSPVLGDLRPLFKRTRKTNGRVPARSR